MDAHVSCTGRSDISELATLRADILDAVNRHDEVVIAADGVEQVHFGFFQLIEAARIHADRQGKALRLSGPLPAQPNAALDLAGLLCGREQDDLAFWFQEDTAS